MLQEWFLVALIMAEECAAWLRHAAANLDGLEFSTAGEKAAVLEALTRSLWESAPGGDGRVPGGGGGGAAAADGAAEGGADAQGGGGGAESGAEAMSSPADTAAEPASPDPIHFQRKAAGRGADYGSRAAAHKACDAAVEQVRSIWAAMARQEGWLARQQGYPPPMLRSYHQLMGVQARIAAVRVQTTTQTTTCTPKTTKTTGVTVYCCVCAGV